MSAAAEFRGVVKRYGRRVALDGLDLAVPRGSVCGLVGSNGAGKTTSMAILSGVLRPDGGTVDVLGEGRFDPARMAGRFTLLPQDADPPREAVVGELLLFYARLQGLAPAAAADAVRDALDWVHLGDRAGSAVRTLSHGMKRRLMIAQAFLGEPELVLLDEPLSGLDPKEVVRARALLAGRRGRQTIVISSHNLHEIELMCDHVIFIEKGRLVRADSLEAITGRAEVLRYLLEAGPPPMEALAERLPDAAFTWRETERCLACRYDAARQSTAAVNRIVLGILLEQNAGILRVEQGARLEAAYLEHADPPPVPTP